jgi:hypothetical protein
MGWAVLIARVKTTINHDKDNIKKTIEKLLTPIMRLEKDAH